MTKGEIQEAIKSAMKGGDTVTLSTLRMLMAAVHNDEIKVRRELTVEEIQKAIMTLCKQRSEAIELFRKGGRNELADKEAQELKVLQRFLPQPLSDDELAAIIRSAIGEVGATTVQDLGKVMKHVMPKVTGRSDGKRVNEIAKSLLGA